MVWKITLALHLAVDKETKKILFDLIEYEKITDINSQKKNISNKC